MLVDAEYELLVIKDRTAFGIYAALKDGHHVHMPPYGDHRIIDDEKKVTSNEGSRPSNVG